MGHTNTVERECITLRNLPTTYLDTGSGDTIVALHGIPTSSALFEPLVPYLQGYHLIAPDLLGQGRTVTPPGGALGYAAYAAHLHDFLALIPPCRFHLLVHDFGGLLGLEWAADHSERVQSLVILSTTITWSMRVSGVLYALNMLCGASAVRGAMEIALCDVPVDPALLDQWSEPWSWRRLWRADHFAAIHLKRIRTKLTKLHMPTCLIWGEHDHVFPLRRAFRILEALPQAHLVTVPSCGHWAALEAPETVGHHIVKFLQKKTVPPVEMDGTSHDRARHQDSHN